MSIFIVYNEVMKHNSSIDKLYIDRFVIYLQHGFATDLNNS